MGKLKRIYFLAGLPRSGSTLLANILAQHPQFYVTPTSGIVDMLVQVRNFWDRNDAFRAHDRQLNETLKRNVLRSMLRGYFEHTEAPVCLDKNRYWCEFLEMAEALIGAREQVKVLVTVRDLRDVAASFELLYRKTSAMGQLPQEEGMALKFKTARGRLEVFADDAQPVGRAFNAVRDAVTRGWLENMCFIEFGELTNRPRETLEKVYAFLGEEPHAHDFKHVEQVTFEDDTVYGFKDLHTIRPRVEPVKPRWREVFDPAVQNNNPVWHNIEQYAEFWRAYVPAGVAGVRHAVRR